MPSVAIRIPINNVKGGGDYTGQIKIGSQGVVANVILDTGSSTLAVVPRVYKIAQDTDVGSSPYAQLVTYGTGGWSGPVIQMRANRVNTCRIAFCTPRLDRSSAAH
jgi:hypothetical protein